MSAVSSSLSLLLKHIFLAAWVLCHVVFSLLNDDDVSVQEQRFSFSADMHNSVVRINGLPGFGRVCKAHAGSSLPSPVRGRRGAGNPPRAPEQQRVVCKLTAIPVRLQEGSKLNPK